MTTWVLLRGLTREVRHWGDVPARLGAALPGARVVALDMPGNGVGWRTPSPASIDAMAAAVRASARARGVRGPVRLLAMSLGAMVATAWCDAAPGEVEAMVLVGTSLRPYSPFHQRLRLSRLPALLRLLALPPGSLARERLVMEITTATARPPGADAEALLAAWAAWQRERPVARRNALRQLWAAARYRSPAHAPRVPVRLLAGAGDRLVDPRCTEAIAAAWGVPHELHPWAGHDVPLDDPAWIVDQVAAFDAVVGHRAHPDFADADSRHEPCNARSEA